ncbi:MAG: YlmC/YmxH family sporulation protein [Clostridia bacterium]|nr:YlmC/YmxH family sporulation protein [Clostridia bacterium]
MQKISDFRQKEVVNISSGARLGFVTDAVIDEANGYVKALIVPQRGKKLGVFGKESEYEILWENIRKIGEDIVLVEGVREVE